MCAFVLLDTRKTYIGETTCGLLGRADKHFDAVNSGSAMDCPRLYGDWRKVGIWNGIFLPICDMSVFGCTKRSRLREEVRTIAEWKAELNVHGSDATGRRIGDSRPYEIVPCKKRGRPFIHQRRKVHGFHRRLQPVPDIPRNPLIFDYIAVLVRRKIGNVHCRAYDWVETSPLRRIYQVCATALSTLHTREWTFFRQNFWALMKLRLDVRQEKVRFRTAWARSGGVTASIVELDSEAVTRTYMGCVSSPCLVVLTLEVIPIGSKSLAEALVNLNKFAKKIGPVSQDVQCPCDLPIFSDFCKLEGHVLDRWSSLAERGVLGDDVPPAWSAKSRLIPDCKQNWISLKDETDCLLDRIAGCRDASSKVGDVLYNFNQRITSFRRMFSSRGNFLRASDVYRLKARFGNLCISNIDRCKSDVAFLCPRMYAEQTVRIFSICGYRWATAADLDAYARIFFKLCHRLSYIPFCRFKKSSAHAFGKAKIWVKDKCWKGGILVHSDWGSVKFRPLVSYFDNHFKKLYQISCRAINFLPNEFLPNSTQCDNVKDFINSVEIFNSSINGFPASRILSWTGGHRFDDDQYRLVSSVLRSVGNCVAAFSRNDDIENFFPSTDRLTALTYLSEVISRCNFKYIMIPKASKLRRVKISKRKRGPQRQGVYREDPHIRNLKPYGSNHWFSHTHDAISVVTGMRRVQGNRAGRVRDWVFSGMSDLEIIIRHDLRFSWVALGTGGRMVQTDGFGQGSPISPGFASFTAGYLEDLRLGEMGGRTRAVPNSEEQRINVLREQRSRWMDDVNVIGIYTSGGRERHKRRFEKTNFFYGPRCNLKQTDPLRWAGVRIYNRGQRFDLTWDSKAILNEVEGSYDPKFNMMINPQGFYRTADLRGIVIGLFSRIVDCTLGNGSFISDQIFFACENIRRRRIEESIIKREINVCDAKWPALNLRFLYSNQGQWGNMARRRMKLLLWTDDSIRSLGEWVWNTWALYISLRFFELFLRYELEASFIWIGRRYPFLFRTYFILYYR